jgi:hypothetical protein
MNGNLLPEAVLIPVTDALRLNAWAGIAVLVSFLSRWWLSQHLDAGGALRTLVALAALVPSLLWARSIAGWMRQLDELQRRIQYEAWFFALIGTVFVQTGLSLLKSADAIPLGRLSQGLGWEGAFALMFALYCAGSLLSNRRYQ